MKFLYLMKHYLIGESSVPSAAIERYRKTKTGKLGNVSAPTEQNDEFWTIKDLKENAAAFTFTVLFFFGLIFLMPFIGLFIK